MLPEKKGAVLSLEMQRLDTELTRTLEKRIAYIGEIAEYLCDMAGEDEIFFRDEMFIEQYRKMLIVPNEKHSEMPDGNTDTDRYGLSRVFSERTGRQVAVMSVYDRAFVCMRMCRLLGICGISGASTFFDGIVTDSETFKYLYDDGSVNGDDVFYEMLVKTDGSRLKDILCAADACGMETVSVEQTKNEDGVFGFVIRINDGGFCGFLSFLYLEKYDFALKGIYGKK